MADNGNINKLLGELSQRLGVDENQLKNAAQQGSLNEVLKNANGNQAEKAEQILNDPQKVQQILSSPQAQALLKLLGGDKNG